MNGATKAADQLPARLNRFVLLQTALILSLSLGFFDSISSILNYSYAHLKLSMFALPTLATVLAIFLAFYVLWWPISRLMRALFPELQTNRLAISFSSFFASLFVFLLIQGMLHRSESEIGLFKQSVLFTASVTIAIGIYLIPQSLTNTPRLRKALIALWIALPFILAEILILLAFSNAHVFRWSMATLSAIITWALFYFRRSVSALPLILLAIAILIAPSGSLSSSANDRAGAQISQHHKLKHIILITVDTLRADALSAYNNKTLPTRNLQKFFDDGVLFKNAISPAPWTQPSFASIFTGVSPLVHGASRHRFGIPNQLPSLAQRLSEAGYYTAAYGTNPILDCTSFSKGFREFRFGGPSMITSFGSSILVRLFPERYDWRPLAGRLSEISIAWLKRHQSEDFFFWVHYFDPHVPYSPPAKYLNGAPLPSGKIRKEFVLRDYNLANQGDFVPSMSERKSIKDLYLGEVQYVDDSIGNLLKALKNLGLYYDSLIIFASDHGEEFWEHGHAGHGRSLYQEVLRVPYAVKLPFPRTNHQVNLLVSTTSITPTILDISGIRYDADSFSEPSIAPLCTEGASILPDRPQFSTGLAAFDEKFSITWKNLHYIQTVTGPEELYDFDRDPGELFSMVSSSPEQLRQARTLIEDNEKAAARLRAYYHISGPVKVDIDEQRELEMRGIGYLH